MENDDMMPPGLKAPVKQMQPDEAQPGEAQPDAVSTADALKEAGLTSVMLEKLKASGLSPQETMVWIQSLGVGTASQKALAEAMGIQWVAAGQKALAEATGTPLGDAAEMKQPAAETTKPVYSHTPAAPDTKQMPGSVEYIWQFWHNGKLYSCAAMHTQGIGWMIDLQKYSEGQWVASTSALAGRIEALLVTMPLFNGMADKMVSKQKPGSTEKAPLNPFPAEGTPLKDMKVSASKEPAATQVVEASLVGVPAGSLGDQIPQAGTKPDDGSAGGSDDF